MSVTFGEDFAAVQRDLEGARQELLDSLTQLTDADLERARRGGWSVSRVVQHVIQSEWHFARMVSQLRDLPPPPASAREGPPASIAEAVHALKAGRQAVNAALKGIEEAAFYRLRTVGREEYSVLSVLENIAHHDREHGQQVQSIVAAR